MSCFTRSILRFSSLQNNPIDTNQSETQNAKVIFASLPDLVSFLLCYFYSARHVLPRSYEELSWNPERIVSVLRKAVRRHDHGLNYRKTRLMV
jgi:hypothetical protein